VIYVPEKGTVVAVSLVASERSKRTEGKPLELRVDSADVGLVRVPGVSDVSSMTVVVYRWVAF
jgi:hypothetical protein